MENEGSSFQGEEVDSEDAEVEANVPDLVDLAQLDEEGQIITTNDEYSEAA